MSFEQPDTMISILRQVAEHGRSALDLFYASDEEWAGALLAHIDNTDDKSDSYPDQTEIARWSSENFPQGSAAEEVIGLVEEVGELCRAVNKRRQGIRGSRDYWTAEIEKELGDIFIKTADVADRLGYTWAHVATKRWATVSRRRDKDGHRPDEAVSVVTGSVGLSCDHAQRFKGCAACDMTWSR